MTQRKTQSPIFVSPDFPDASGGGPAAAPHAGLARLAAVILDANERMNLTADRDPALFWARHIVDAAESARRIEAALGPPAAGERILDVGSGGGIPGLAWAVLWPAARVELMEARLKRVEFLRQAAAELGLGNVTVHEGRAEQLGQNPALREQFGLVTARALAAMPTLLELTLPFVRVGGWLAAIKSQPVAEELAQGRAAAETLGGEAGAAVEPYLRGDGKPCAVCLVRKLRPTPPGYPRRPNLPERRPILTRNS